MKGIQQEILCRTGISRFCRRPFVFNRLGFRCQAFKFGPCWTLGPSVLASKYPLTSTETLICPYQAPISTLSSTSDAVLRNANQTIVAIFVSRPESETVILLEIQYLKSIINQSFKFAPRTSHVAITDSWLLSTAQL